MKAIIFFFLLCISISSFGCSMFCGLQDVSDPALNIFEGKVVGYVGNFPEEEGIEGEFGFVKFKVTKIHSTQLRLDTVLLFIYGVNSWCGKVGNNVDSLKKWYPIDSVWGGVARLVKEGCQYREETILSMGVCNRPYPKIHGRKNNYKKNRIHEYEFQKALIETEVESRKTLWDERERFQNKFRNVTFQTYLDLLKIYRSYSPKKTFKILKKLIWLPDYCNSEFIQKQRISPKQKRILEKQIEKINRIYDMNKLYSKK